MLPVETAVLIDHLRLDPNAEFHAKAVDSANQVSQSSLQLICIDKPVAQPRVIAVAAAKPAVIQYQHLNPQFRGLSGNRKDLFFIKIKIGGLPVVDEDGPPGKPVFSSA